MLTTRHHGIAAMIIVSLALSAGCSTRPPQTIPAGPIRITTRLAPPPPPCTNQTQFERAAARVQPDSVTAPTPTRLPAFPGRPAPQIRPLVIDVFVRVDSLGKFRENDIKVEGLPGRRDQDYVVSFVRKSLQFRPAVLLPDRCAVPGISRLTFTFP